MKIPTGTSTAVANKSIEARWTFMNSRLIETQCSPCWTRVYLAYSAGHPFSLITIESIHNHIHTYFVQSQLVCGIPIIILGPYYTPLARWYVYKPQTSTLPVGLRILGPVQRGLTPARRRVRLGVAWGPSEIEVWKASNSTASRGSRIHISLLLTCNPHFESLPLAWMLVTLMFSIIPGSPMAKHDS